MQLTALCCLAAQIIRDFLNDDLTAEELTRYDLVTEGVMFSGTGGMEILFNWRVRAGRRALHSVWCFKWVWQGMHEGAVEHSWLDANCCTETLFQMHSTAMQPG